jgi:hypothetical protein
MVRGRRPDGVVVSTAGTGHPTAATSHVSADLGGKQSKGMGHCGWWALAIRGCALAPSQRYHELTLGCVVHARDTLLLTPNGVEGHTLGWAAHSVGAVSGQSW